MKIKISVIMGIYNCEETLSESLNSLLDQTYKGFKVIMCNDGSSDNTYKVAEKYVEKYPNKFILLNNSVNKGLNYTLNKCLSVVDTEYVARMDGDDISVPTRFEKQLAFLEKNLEFSFVSSAMIHFDEDGEWGRSKVIISPEKEDFMQGTPFSHAASLIRTSAMKLVDGYSEHQMLNRVEDYHLWMKMYQNGLKGYNLTDHLYKMRDDHNAVLRRDLKNRLNEVYIKCLIARNFNISVLKYGHILKPLVAIILPNSIYKVIHKKKLNSDM